jgi:hypothetical protein
MRNFLKIAALGAALTLSAPFALANPIYGTLNIQSRDSSVFALNSAITNPSKLPTSPNIDFQPNSGANGTVLSNTYITTATGDLAAYVGNAVAFKPADYTTNIGFASLFGGARMGFLFSIDDGGPNPLSFFAYSATNSFSSLNGSPYEFANFLGYITDGMGGKNGATFSISGPGSEGDFTAISGKLTTAPEPNSLILLGTGLIAAAGMMLRKRQLAEL